MSKKIVKFVPGVGVDISILNFRGLLCLLILGATRGRLTVWRRHAEKALVDLDDKG